MRKKLELTELSLREELAVRISYARDKVKWMKKNSRFFPDEAPLEKQYWLGYLAALETVWKLLP